MNGREDCAALADQLAPVEAGGFVIRTPSRFGKRGLASMPLEKRVAIARKGGHAVHAMGRAHEWTRAEAIEHGRKGGLTPRRKRDPDGEDAA